MICCCCVYNIRDKIVGRVPFKSIGSVVGISMFVLISSQLLGNVAVIQLAKPNIEVLDDNSRRFAWAVLSFVATVGGNLTITGSAGEFKNKSQKLLPFQVFYCYLFVSQHYSG